MYIVYASFVILGALSLILQFLAQKNNDDDTINNNPQFLKFQRGYFLAYLLAMFADWLQGPYLYKLYTYYGFQEEQIAVLYVFGFASTVIIGMWAPLAADQFGRKKLCISFTVLYSLSCLLKLSRSYGILILGRIIGGVATSVLFSAFEAWYVHEHIETHDFPKEWISQTFAKASTWNGILAVVAGLTTNLLSEGLNFGPVAPYMFAIPFLIGAGVLVSVNWIENFSGHKVKFRKACGDGFKTIFTKETIFMVGVIEALFESVIYIIIFLWTPILEPAKPTLGLVFSCFMVSILAGQATFQILSSRLVRTPLLLLLACSIAIIANMLCVTSTHPGRSDTNATFIALLIFEFAVGIYFPCMGQLRSRIIPEQHRWSIMNWFRVPLNLIACIVLMLLHEDVFRHGNSMIFVICTGLLILSILCGARLFKLTRDSDNFSQEPTLLRNEYIHNIF